MLANDFWVVCAHGSRSAGSSIRRSFGTYLLNRIQRVRFHWNEAFYFVADRNYKGFLGSRSISAENLTVYPITVERVPRSTTGELLPRLVEKPIE